MTEDQKIEIEDPPDPAIQDVQQRDLPLPRVPVIVEGKVRVQPLPARNAGVFTFPMDTTVRLAMGPDMKRSRALLVSTVAWQISRKASGEKVPWPANVVMEIKHADAVWASVPTSTGTLSIVAEYYAD